MTGLGSAPLAGLKLGLGWDEGVGARWGMGIAVIIARVTPEARIRLGRALRVRVEGRARYGIRERMRR